MSEEERKIRLGYRKVRKRRITLLTVLLSLVLVATLISSVLASVLDKSYYVNYSEKSSADYGVHLKDNDFYEDSYLGKDYAYVASLIDKVEASFKYEILMNSNTDVDFEYTYRIDSVVQIKDKSNSKILYAPVYSEVDGITNSVSGKNLVIAQKVLVDYGKYNEIANRFVNAYNLNYTDATLLLRLVVDVNGQSDSFHDDENNSSYVASVSIPLRTDTVEIKITSDAPVSEGRILSYSTKDVAKLFQKAAIISACVTAFLAIVLWSYAYLSRNVDVTYDIKVAKLVRSYKSFIQKIQNEFDTCGYQLILISEFEEMLEIRDTIQSPILMQENSDRTCTKFLIPTNTKLLYLYEIKVDDYDAIYARDNEAGESIQPVFTEITTVNENMPEEAPTPTTEAMSPVDKPIDTAPVDKAPTEIIESTFEIRAVQKTTAAPKKAIKPALEEAATPAPQVIKAKGCPKIIHNSIEPKKEEPDGLVKSNGNTENEYSHLPLFKIKTRKNTIHLRCELNEKELDNAKLNYDYKHKLTF